MPLTSGSNFGPYRIIEPLGRGGMAAVYKAFEAGLDRYVALKVLPAHFLHDPDFAERFKREAKVIAKLEHPNIVPIFSFGVEEEIPWMAMRLIAGGSVSDLLKKTHRGLARERVVSILRGVASALVYAHGRGVLHRDVKPQNILIDEADHVYLADFGIAKMVEGSVALTKSGMITGTPQYMSPEQARAEGVDAHTDTYALGIVAYELLTGRLPFTADTPVAVLMKHVMDPIPLVSPDEVSEPLMRTVLKALAKQPGDRWETPVAFTDALAEAVGMPLGTTPPAPRQQSPTVTIGGPKPVRGAPPDRPTSPLLPSQEETGTLVPPKPRVEGPTERITEEKGPPRPRPKPRPRRQAAPQPAAGRGASAPSSTREQPRPRDSRLIFLAAVASLALVLLGGIAVWLWLRGSEPQGPAVSDRPPISTVSVPVPTSTPTPDATPSPMPTPEPTPEPTPTPDATPSPMPTPEPTPEPTPTPTPDPGPRAGAVMRNAKDALEYVYIPPGTFKMGCVPGDSGCDDDEKPRHEVTITRGFWLGKTEVTWGAYRRFFQVADAMGNKGSGAGDRHPVVNVSWNDAVAFCSWSGGRLPTEAEWEYAARGGVEGKKYPWGNSLDHEQANYSGTGGRDRWDRTSPVGSFAPNGYGLYDMAGNVWEWVWDWYDANYYSTASGSDPRGPSSGTRRVLRGGSWHRGPGFLRVSFRNWLDPGGGDVGSGFRCSRDAS